MGVLRDRCDIVASFRFDDDDGDDCGGAGYDKASSPGIFFKNFFWWRGTMR